MTRLRKNTQAFNSILEALANLASSSSGDEGISSRSLARHLDMPWATLKRHLEKLVLSNKVVKSGRGKATRYFPASASREPEQSGARPIKSTSLILSEASQNLLNQIQLPLAVRPYVSYDTDFLNQYVPNESFLLSKNLADSLHNEGRMIGQLPAGTYVRKVLEQVLIDLSWSSSRLEGNRKTLLATEQLFKSGEVDGDPEAIMLLNHKKAIEFLVEAVPEYGLTNSLIFNVHSILMQDLLSDSSGLGTIRNQVVNITDSTYVPSQLPQQLDEYFTRIVDKSRLIKNPVEAAFFLWTNIAYLQPFEDGNKRTSRLAANIPLMLYNCAPLSFNDVGIQDYAHAMLGIYERRDTSIAQDLFAWTYRRSIQRYGAVRQSLGVPNPFRIKYRGILSQSVQEIIRDGRTISISLANLAIPPDDKAEFEKMLREELSSLTPNNCGRYGVTIQQTQAWVSKGRPI